MIMDLNLTFDGDGTTPAAITVTRDSTNVIDMGVAAEYSVGEPLAVTVQTDGLFAAAGAGTLTIGLAGSPDNSAWVTYASTPALSIAQLNSRVVGGQPYAMAWTLIPRLPAGARPRYYKLIYTVATGPFTAGAVHAFVNLGRDHEEAYPRNYSVTGIAP